ncbi:phage tail tape measure protein [Laribacter hongkongensis]|uniref:phage tail tape measure protein n=2 Tax=Bacteria TaxID=2 RepID=UPI001EFDC411|nr:phage tail tape measure protein [Laribacter hongkongensis]MCG8995050.1 phage tail tape measure protein [Laribacter hongkongensis]MCG9023560.1 phage tail tape measure protein [Laribacter hongkongensis]MCG9074593.1 phage tail tape measure protein [Laribacter hongkongensis]
MALSKNLRLEVILAATDKLTGPLKKAMAGSKGLAAAVRASQTGLKELQGQQQRLTAFRDLSRETKDTALKLKAARQNLAGLQQQMASARTVTSSMTRKLATAQAAVSKLSSAHRMQLATLRHNRTELEAQGLSVSKLASHEQRLGRQIDTTSQALARQSEQLKRVSDRQKALHAAKGRYDKTLAVRDKVAGAGAASAASAAAVGGALAVPVINYAAAEDAATQLKVAMMLKDGTVAPEFERMNRLAEQLGNRLPGTTAELQGMMTMLVRQGLSFDAILGGLGEASAYLGVQLKLPYETAAEYAAKMQDATGALESEMMDVMDTIQRTYYVGVDTSNMVSGFSKLAPVLDMIKQKGAAGARTMAPLLAMADQANLVGESAGNAYRKVFQRSMDKKKVSDGNDLLEKRGIAKLDFTNGKGEFGGVEQMFTQLQKLKKLNTQDRLAVIGDIWGDDAETLQALNIMIDKGMDGYREMAAKMEAQADLRKRVDVQLGTLSNLWDAASGTFTNAMVKFGEVISPELKAITEWLANASEKLSTWASANPVMAAGIMKTIAVIGLLLAAFAGLSLGLAAILGPMAIAKLTLATLGIKLASGISIIGKLGAAVMWLGKIFLTTPIGLAVAAVAAAAYLVWSNWGVIAPKMQALWASVTDGANAAWQWIKSVILSVAGSIGDFLMNWTIVGFVSDHWQDIRAITLAVWSIIKTGVAAVGQALVGFFMNWTIVGAVIRNWDVIKAATAAAWDWVRKLAVGAGSGILAFFMNWTLVGVVVRHWDSIISFMRGLVSTFTTIGSQIMQGMIAGLVSGLTSLKNTINGIGEGVISWLKDKLDIHSPSRVFAALGGFTMAGFQQGLEQGQSGPLGAVQSLAGKLTAIGAGVMIGGGLAQADAIRIDNRPPVAMAAPAAQGSGAVVQQVFNIYAAPGMDERALAAMVRREVEAAARAQAVRGRSSLKDRE